MDRLETPTGQHAPEYLEASNFPVKKLNGKFVQVGSINDRPVYCKVLGGGKGANIALWSSMNIWFITKLSDLGNNNIYARNKDASSDPSKLRLSWKIYVEGKFRYVEKARFTECPECEIVAREKKLVNKDGSIRFLALERNESEDVDIEKNWSGPASTHASTVDLRTTLALKKSDDIEVNSPGKLKLGSPSLNFNRNLSSKWTEKAEAKDDQKYGAESEGIEIGKLVVVVSPYEKHFYQKVGVVQEIVSGGLAKVMFFHEYMTSDFPSIKIRALQLYEDINIRDITVAPYNRNSNLSDASSLPVTVDEEGSDYSDDIGLSDQPEDELKDDQRGRGKALTEDRKNMLRRHWWPDMKDGNVRSGPLLKLSGIHKKRSWGRKWQERDCTLTENGNFTYLSRKGSVRGHKSKNREVILNLDNEYLLSVTTCPEDWNRQTKGKKNERKWSFKPHDGSLTEAISWGLAFGYFGHPEKRIRYLLFDGFRAYQNERDLTHLNGVWVNTGMIIDFKHEISGFQVRRPTYRSPDWSMILWFSPHEVNWILAPRTSPTKFWVKTKNSDAKFPGDRKGTIWEVYGKNMDLIESSDKITCRNWEEDFTRSSRMLLSISSKVVIPSRRERTG